MYLENIVSELQIRFDLIFCCGSLRLNFSKKLLEGILFLFGHWYLIAGTNPEVCVDWIAHPLGSTILTNLEFVQDGFHAIPVDLRKK